MGKSLNLSAGLMGLAALLFSACGADNKTIAVEYTVATGASSAPNLVVLISLSPDQSTFSQNLNPRDGHYFYDSAENLKKCAVNLGFIKADGFVTGSTTGSCDSFGTSLTSGAVGTAAVNLPNDPLSTDAYNLIDSSDGYVFMLFLYNANIAKSATPGVRCFELCAAQVQSKRFLIYDSLTTSLTPADTLNCTLYRKSPSDHNSRCFDY
ncbi:MAG: hypothetical protein J0L93_10990 [Deltaproteobacteria bacterium]|nr:hypothetical protein [Deltaproteobacteria bacterium]